MGTIVRPVVYRLVAGGFLALDWEPPELEGLKETGGKNIANNKSSGQKLTGASGKNGGRR